MCANSVADSTSLLLPIPSVKDLCRKVRDKAPSANDLSHEARDKAPLSANNETILASPKGRALHNKAKLAFKGRAKIVAS